MTKRRIFGIIFLVLALMFLGLAIYFFVSGIMNSGGNINFVVGPIIGLVIFLPVAIGFIIPGLIMLIKK